MSVSDPEFLLSHLLSLQGENEWLEFKSNLSEPKKIGRYISGLSNSAMLHNEEHAYLVFGIEDETREITGTSVRLRELKVGNDSLLFWLDKMLSPHLNLEVCSVDIGDKHVEILVIDPAYRQPVRFEQQAYIRVDTSLQTLSQHPERERMVWSATSRFSFEQGVAQAHASIDEIREKIDCEALLKGLVKRRDTPSGVEDFLLKEELILDDRQGGYDVTNLLALAAARNLPEWRSVANKGARVVTFKGTDKLNATSDNTGKLGYAIAFERVLLHIMKQLPQKEALVHGLRRVEYAAPEDAIREILANALIHQDLTIAEGRPLIEVFLDRIRISNPGRPLIDPDRFIDAPPRSRNQQLGLLMRRLGICEERGSGIDRAMIEIERAALPPPLFQVAEDSTVVTIFFKRPFAEWSKEDRVRACYQHACLSLETGSYMSNATLRARFGLTDKQYPQVSIVIREAIEQGRVRPLDEDQGKRNARYVPYWA